MSPSAAEIARLHKVVVHTKLAYDKVKNLRNGAPKKEDAKRALVEAQEALTLAQTPSVEPAVTPQAAEVGPHSPPHNTISAGSLNARDTSPLTSIAASDDNHHPTTDLHLPATPPASAGLDDDHQADRFLANDEGHRPKTGLHLPDQNAAYQVNAPNQDHPPITTGNYGFDPGLLPDELRMDPSAHNQYVDPRSLALNASPPAMGAYRADPGAYHTDPGPYRADPGAFTAGQSENAANSRTYAAEPHAYATEPRADVVYQHAYGVDQRTYPADQNAAQLTMGAYTAGPREYDHTADQRAHHDNPHPAPYEPDQRADNFHAENPRMQLNGADGTVYKFPYHYEAPDANNQITVHPSSNALAGVFGSEGQPFIQPKATTVPLGASVPLKRKASSTLRPNQGPGKKGPMSKKPTKIESDGPDDDDGDEDEDEEDDEQDETKSEPVPECVAEIIEPCAREVAWFLHNGHAISAPVRKDIIQKPGFMVWAACHSAALSEAILTTSKGNVNCLTHKARRHGRNGKKKEAAKVAGKPKKGKGKAKTKAKAKATVTADGQPAEEDRNNGLNNEHPDASDQAVGGATVLATTSTATSIPASAPKLAKQRKAVPSVVDDLEEFRGVPGPVSIVLGLKAASGKNKRVPGTGTLSCGCDAHDAIHQFRLFKTTVTHSKNPRFSAVDQRMKTVTKELIPHVAIPLLRAFEIQALKDATALNNLAVFFSGETQNTPSPLHTMRVAEGVISAHQERLTNVLGIKSCMFYALPNMSEAEALQHFIASAQARLNELERPLNMQAHLNELAGPSHA